MPRQLKHMALQHTHPMLGLNIYANSDFSLDALFYSELLMAIFGGYWQEVTRFIEERVQK